ncbi:MULTISPECIES: type I-E CRISPR-associated protein Cas7/Cse4/CasC [Auritidibacter]|uniref:type I-E CRISPR-associated protein Cas7/Cse4/CasC n=1 Tax=Auritidibacter TaxID=1160973 RepID=UPI000D725BF7|nr:MULTISPECIES: type I-E CRISPR-associated protein Cas7/Cse4/CasC [Auritidibacter]PXA79272.1 type I-E CRISPR-associated protein Cas7/Cse4/CasC [Auritidibacter sp. NML120779]PXA79351.1 type I-E CRISPR-associated protein Cas7/Cse4/CasC [Auritidibacter sp. NML120636]WGH80918.1 type I-E CRISPR-associated protein Cas7/Cse4/CasC [Auritidibacter ignavus]WGH83401.1 type I-E CRISPR-associated protein Cas7/Cse4/CasC [Auritidibacter ignavus]WGH85534.1 type I-E CRISPR-associated protein Cas7/Cse4/CasC [A
MTLYIDLHTIQTVPPSNINRDETGAPKTATFGGVPRHRVSSQAWKRAIRKDFKERLPQDQLGVRTKRVISKIVVRTQELVVERGLDESDWSAERIGEIAEAILKAGKITVEKKDKKSETDKEDLTELPQSRYLIFLSDQQITNVARAILEDPDQKWTKKVVDPLLDQDHSVDIAMFGRMIADEPAYNVDAAVQVAHAIGVGPSEPEFDYFTAVDDEVEDAEETGAGMIGTVQMMSSTLYRYATVSVDSLLANLGDAEVTKAAVEAFIQAFIQSLPSGKINTFANQTLPELVVVSLRNDRPVSYVNAFEEPVLGDADGGRRHETVRRLVDEERGLEEMYGMSPIKSWVLAARSIAETATQLGELSTLSELVGNVRFELDAYL